MTRPCRCLAKMASTFVLALAVAGCGDPAPPMGDVEGAVTADGSPVLLGTVTFTPADGVRPAAACDIKDGKYAVRVGVGPCKVQVRMLKKVGEKKAYGNEPNSPVVPIYEEGLAAEFNDKSTLTYEVAAGKATKNWEAKTRAKK